MKYVQNLHHVQLALTQVLETTVSTENKHSLIWPYLFFIASLGPPILSTNATASALNVHAILPLGPNGQSIGDIIARGNNRSSELQVSYTLHITSPEWAAQVNLSLIWSFAHTSTLNQSILFFEPMFCVCRRRKMKMVVSLSSS